MSSLNGFRLLCALKQSITETAYAWHGMSGRIPTTCYLKVTKNLNGILLCN